MNQMLQDPQMQDSEIQDSEIQDSQVQVSQTLDTQAQDSKAQASSVKSPPDAVEPPAAPAHPRFARPQRIAFVQACWHREVVEEAKIAFLAEIEARHIPRERVDIFEVPGSFEIPLHAQILAKTRRYTAIVAAGLVVDGGIYRHEFVSDTVIKALMDVQLRTEVPVFSAVLTPQQFHETQAHFDFFRKHFAVKGVEVAEACANTLLSLERLRGQVAAGIVQSG